MTLSSDAAPLEAGARLRRLLSILAYLARVGEASIAEIAQRFSVDEEIVVSELELAACCGLPPYTPDQLLELVVDETSVRAFGLDALRRPPRLSEQEGFALAAGARALLAVPGSESHEALASALAKLEGALGAGGLRVELERPAHLDDLRGAAARGEMIEIDYLGAHRGDETTRVVEAYEVAAREGRFYLDAFCHLADDWRRFALDRITAVRLLHRRGEPRVPPAQLRGARAFAGGDSLSTARIAVTGELRGLLDRYAKEAPELGEDGRYVYVLEVADEQWLGRLLLRLGDSAELLGPAVFADAKANVATAALARYTEPE